MYITVWQAALVSSLLVVVTQCAVTNHKRGPHPSVKAQKQQTLIRKISHGRQAHVVALHPARNTKTRTAQHESKHPPPQNGKRDTNTKLVITKNVDKIARPKLRKNNLTKAKKGVSKPAAKLMKEFPFNEIMFRGRATNQANEFIKANDKLGKQMEIVYERAREQDLDDIEQKIRQRYLDYTTAR